MSINLTLPDTPAEFAAELAAHLDERIRQIRKHGRDEEADQWQDIADSIHDCGVFLAQKGTTDAR